MASASVPVADPSSDEDSENYDPAQDELRTPIDTSSWTFAALSSDTVMDAIRDGRALPKPRFEKVDTTLQPGQEGWTLPAAVKVKDGNADVWVEYVPMWTNPDWEDFLVEMDGVVGTLKPDIADADKTWTGRPNFLRRGDVLQQMRPALLPKDVQFEPTAYARRFGINPDGPTLGRSRFSPMDATSRRVSFLKGPSSAVPGIKGFVNWDDWKAAEEAYQMGLGAGSVSDSFLEELRAAAELPGADPKYRALLELHDMILEDKDFQRLVSGQLDTDERIKFGVHSIADDLAPQSDLGGQLHRLLQRRMWRNPRNAGTSEDSPLLVYDLCGQKGVWAAGNDQVWQAMQPALQLVSRVLLSNHPVWTGLLDIFTRRPVEPTRDPRLRPRVRKGNPRLLRFWAHNSSIPEDMIPAAERLRSSGWDCAQDVLVELEFKLELGLTTRYRFGDETKIDDGDFSFAETSISWGNRITVDLAVEMIWPLLVPQYTLAEKTASSTMFAFTLIHELAHAASFAMIEMFHKNSLGDPPFSLGSAKSPPTPQQKMDLEVVANEYANEDLYRKQTDEPYYTDEPVGEAGFAVENAIFGGCIYAETTPYFDSEKPHLGNTTIAVQFREWPHGQAARLETEDDRLGAQPVLLDPPISRHKILCNLSIKDVTKFFQQNFWEFEIDKYGTESLLIDRTAPTGYVHQFYEIVLWQRTYGPSRVEWLMIAVRKLRQAGQYIIADFIIEAGLEGIGCKHIAQRWYEEVATMPVRDKVFERLVEKLTSEFNACQDLLQQLVNQEIGVEQKAELVTSLNSSLVQVVRTFLPFQMSQLHRLQHYENMIVDLLKRDVKTRRVLLRLFGKQVLESLTERYCLIPMKNVETIENIARAAVGLGVLGPEVAVEVDRVSHKGRALAGRFDALQPYLNEAWVNNLEQGPNAPWKGKFETVAEGNYRSWKSKLEKSAAREFAFLPSEVRRVVECCLEIIRVNTFAPDGLDEDALCNLILTTLDEGNETKDRLGRRISFNGPTPDALSLAARQQESRESLDSLWRATTTLPAPQLLSSAVNLPPRASAAYPVHLRAPVPSYTPDMPLNMPSSFRPMGQRDTIVPDRPSSAVPPGRGFASFAQGPNPFAVAGQVPMDNLGTQGNNNPWQGLWTDFRESGP